MDTFQGHSERFHLRLVDDRESNDVCLDLSIDGLRVSDRGGSLTKRKIPLDHITRWTRSHDRVTMFVKTPVDIEEKPVSFYGSSSALSSLLDTLTSFCLQCASALHQRSQTRLCMNECLCIVFVLSHTQVRTSHLPAGMLQNLFHVQAWVDA